MALSKEYYLDNFLQMAHYAVKRYASFFTATEHTLFQTFFQCSPSAQALYVRLFNRKPLIFREDKLQYAEFGLISSAVQELEAKHFVNTKRDSFPILELLETFTLPELKKIATSLSFQKALKKEELLSLLTPPLEADRTLLPQLSWISIAQKELFLRLRVLFFCNRSQDMSDFVLVDLGKTQYETYSIEENFFYFPHRQALEAYLFWGEQRDRFWEVCSQKNVALMKDTVQKLLSTPIPEFPASRYYRQMLFAGTYAYELTQDWKNASLCYEKLLQQEYWFETASRYILCLEKQWYYQTAREKTQVFLPQSSSLTQELFFQFHLQKQEKALKIKPTRFPPICSPVIQTFFGQQTSSYLGSKATFQGKGERPVTVETLVLEAFEEEGWEGIFAENGFILSLAGFLCWDILFAPVSGVFQHPYQSGPLDLFSSKFYERRQILFTDHLCRIAHLEQKDLLDYFQTQYTQKRLLQCGLTFAGAGFALESYLPFLQFSTGERLATLLLHLFQTLGEKRRGFPDLVLWRKDPLQLKIVEVKGPSDRLSDAQKSWIDLLIKLGYEVSLAQVVSSRE